MTWCTHFGPRTRNRCLHAAHRMTHRGDYPHCASARISASWFVFCLEVA